MSPERPARPRRCAWPSGVRDSAFPARATSARRCAAASRSSSTARPATARRSSPGPRRLHEHAGGEIYVPYAIQAENSIITVFDPASISRPTTATWHGVAGVGFVRAIELRRRTTGTVDLRWRRDQRPVVITGGELTLDMLDLRYNNGRQLLPGPAARQGQRRRVPDRRLRPPAVSAPRNCSIAGSCRSKTDTTS